MNLKVLLPTHVLVDQPVRKVIGEAENGSFCLLERHTDFVTALVPGIVAFMDDEGVEQFAAVGEGILVKSGPQVRISTRHAVRGTNLGTLRRTVREEFDLLDERERSVRSAIARLEADFVRRFLEFGEAGRV